MLPIQVMELGAKLQQYKEPAKAQGDMTQLQQQDAQLQEQLQVRLMSTHNTQGVRLGLGRLAVGKSGGAWRACA